jgi:hypothetical protein
MGLDAAIEGFTHGSTGGRTTVHNTDSEASLRELDRNRGTGRPSTDYNYIKGHFSSFQ